MKSIGPKAILFAILCAQACTPEWDNGDRYSSETSEATVDVGNASSLPGNASSLPGNASSLPGNGSSLPGNGSNIVASESRAWMVKPRTTTATTCGAFALSSQWEFAASYRCNGTGRIHTSDIAIAGNKLGASLCTQCGTSTPRRVYLPATVSNVDRTATIDVVLAIDFAGASVYDCAKDDYAVMVYDLSISKDNCQTFSTPDRVTAVPAPQHLFAGAQGLAPAGGGWGLLVPATTTSAVFKAAHYTKMVTTFYPERADGWKYAYSTTNTPCGQAGSSCLNGASMLLGYGLALANLAPVTVSGTTYGVSGTVTGIPTWVSILTASGTLNKTYLEVGASVVANDYVLPGIVERSRVPYPYDAVFGPAQHMFTSTRAGYGANRARVDLARRALCGGTVSCTDSTAQGALFTNYNAGMTASPASKTLNIREMFSAVAGSSPFVVTAMPDTGTTTSCTTADQRRSKQRVDVPGPTFCLGGYSPPPTPTPDAGVGSGSGSGSTMYDAGVNSGSGSGSSSTTYDAGTGSGTGSGSGS